MDYKGFVMSTLCSHKEQDLFADLPFSLQSLLRKAVLRRMNDSSLKVIVLVKSESSSIT